MSSWDIDPAGVKGVLSRTESVAEKLQGEFSAINSAAESAAENSSSSIIAEALSGFLQARTPDLQYLVNRSVAAMTGAVKATNAYLQGDLAMAANAQAAVNAAPSGEFAVHGRMRAN